MSELKITSFGEVKLGYDVIGQIAWATPIAHLSAAGEWFAANRVWDDLPGPVEEELDRLRDEVSELEDALARERSRAVRLAAQLAEVRSMLEVS